MTTYEIKHRLPAPERKESIINAAIVLFSEKGFAGTTTRELAAAVGVSEPVLYGHFCTKHELYEAVLERISDSAVAEMEQLMLQYAHHEDAHTVLRGVAQSVLQTFLITPEYVRLILFSALEGEEVSRDFYIRLRGRILDAVSKLVDDQTKSSFDAQTVAHAFFCMMAHHGLITLLFHGSSTNSDEQMVTEMIDLFIRGFAK